MTFTEIEFSKIIDGVGRAANERKKNIKMEYQKAMGDDYDLPPIKWYRRRKNSDIKDALTLEGIKRGFSVRAEKTMGADKEYCEKDDQDSFNRFDLSWEKNKNSRDFSLIVEIEMDLKINSIKKDFQKLIENKNNCLKAMVCQAENEHDMMHIMKTVKNLLQASQDNRGWFVLSIWVWSKAGFAHSNFEPN
jgi:hypothetical protein